MPKRLGVPAMTPGVYPDPPFLWGGYIVTMALYVRKVDIQYVLQAFAESFVVHVQSIGWPAHGAYLRLWSNLGAPRQCSNCRGGWEVDPPYLTLPTPLPLVKI